MKAEGVEAQRISTADERDERGFKCAEAAKPVSNLCQPFSISVYKRLLAVHFHSL
jgi:hypothetical protein